MSHDELYSRLTYAQMVDGVTFVSQLLGGPHGSMDLWYAVGLVARLHPPWLTSSTVQHLLSKERVPFTATYFGSIALTLYFALGVGAPS